MAIQGMMFLNNRHFSALENWKFMLRSDRLDQGRGVPDKHLGNSQHDAEVTLDTASCLTFESTNPAIVRDAVELYAQNA